MLVHQRKHSIIGQVVATVDGKMAIGRQVFETSGCLTIYQNRFLHFEGSYVSDVDVTPAKIFGTIYREDNGSQVYLRTAQGVHLTLGKISVCCTSGDVLVTNSSSQKLEISSVLASDVAQIEPEHVDYANIIQIDNHISFMRTDGCYTIKETYIIHYDESKKSGMRFSGCIADEIKSKPTKNFGTIVQEFDGTKVCGVYFRRPDGTHNQFTEIVIRSSGAIVLHEPSYGPTPPNIIPIAGIVTVPFVPAPQIAPSVTLPSLIIPSVPQVIRKDVGFSSEPKQIQTTELKLFLSADAFDYIEKQKGKTWIAKNGYKILITSPSSVILNFDDLALLYPVSMKSKTIVLRQHEDKVSQKAFGPRYLNLLKEALQELADTLREQNTTEDITFL